ncbi:MAG: hypothetical protein DWI30_04565 [Chloroflexi bacterium]|nr:MAG: hypothetical protein DWI30_04565 [Chloroflexota bacterium]
MQQLRNLVYPVLTWLIMVAAVIVVCVVGYGALWPTKLVLPWSANGVSPFQGFYAIQTDDVGPYRWSKTDSTIRIAGVADHTMSIMQLIVSDSGRPVPVSLRSGSLVVTTIVAQQTRHIALLLPLIHANVDTTVHMYAPPFVHPADERQLGVRVRSVTLLMASSNTLALSWLGVLLWVALIIWVSAWLLRAHRVVVWLSGVLGAPLLFAGAIIINASMTAAWLMSWALVLPLVPLLIVVMRWLRLPTVVQSAVAFWVAVRLLLVVYPAFDGHDFLIHAKRLGEFHRLQSLTLLDHPFEFSGRPALILPLFYWLSDALARVVGLDLAMHVVIVCAESLLAVVVWLILRQCQVPARTAIIATLLTLAMPIATAILWWSFMPQVLAHLLAFVVIYATLRRDRWGAVLAGVAMAGVVWTHIGEVLIVAVWYSAVRVSEPDRGSAAWWWRWLPTVLLPLSATSLYVNYVYTLFHSEPTAARIVPFRFANMLAQMKEGLAVGFAPIAWWITPLLALVAWRRLPQLAPAWAVTVVFWLGVELITGYQVRYGYLAVPLIAIGLAYCLTPLTRYGRAGWVFALTIVLFVTWVSLALWVDATLLGVHPRVDGLSH